jgi:formylglycine-generating enzyme required for sulfatase activity
MGSRAHTRTEEAATADRLAWRRAVAVLVVCVIVGIIGWLNQKYIQEQFHWRMKMGPSVLTAEQEKDWAAKPGSEFKECTKDCPTMIVVPAGSFMMGEKGKQQEVTIGRSFTVSKFDVIMTFAEWDQCSAAGVCPQAHDSGWGRGDRPVINVSWDDAKLYVAWLSRVTGKPYRLLTEAEWKYAARAGTTTTYSWGDDIGMGNANCNGCGSRRDNKQTAPVGSFKPNAFGLHDMHGNVLQRVEDAYQEYDKQAPTDGSASQGGNTSLRVARGGAWNREPQLLGSARRFQGPTRQPPLWCRLPSCRAL